MIHLNIIIVPALRSFKLCIFF